MEGDNNLQMQPGMAQTPVEPNKPEMAQTSIDLNKPAVRRRRGWERFALPLLLILGIGVVVAILIITLNVTGIINGDDEGDNTVLTEEEYEQLMEDIEGIEINPYLLMTFEDNGEGFLGQVEAYENSDGVSENDLIAFQSKIAEYLNEQEDINSKDYTLAIMALARAYFMTDRANEGIALLESSAVQTSVDANKVYYYITLYDYYTNIEDDEKRLATIGQIISFPEGINMEEDDYYALVEKYSEIAKGIMGGGDE